MSSRTLIFDLSSSSKSFTITSISIHRSTTLFCFHLFSHCPKYIYSARSTLLDCPFYYHSNIYLLQMKFLSEYFILFDKLIRQCHCCHSCSFEQLFSTVRTEISYRNFVCFPPSPLLLDKRVFQHVFPFL